MVITYKSWLICSTMMKTMWSNRKKVKKIIIINQLTLLHQEKYIFGTEENKI